MLNLLKKDLEVKEGDKDEELILKIKKNSIVNYRRKIFFLACWSFDDA